MKTDINLKAEIIAALLGNSERVEDLTEDDPRKKAGQEIGDAFTQAVAFLKVAFPSVSLRKLMALVWDLVGTKIVPFGLGPQVKTLSMATAVKDGVPTAIILAPHDWVDQVKEDPILQTGAVIFVGSQVVDVYNRKVLSRESHKECIARARAHEAEFLSIIAKRVPAHPFNEYQRAILDEYPQGLSSDAARPLLYESKPFVKPS